MPSGVGVCSLPIPQVNASDKLFGTVSIPMFTVSASGYNLAAIVMPIPEVRGTGVYLRIYHNIELPVPSVSSIGYSGVFGKGNTILPIPSAIGWSYPRGYGIVILPVFKVSQIPTGQGIGSIVIPRFEVFGAGSIDTTQYLGVVMNMSNQAISTYSGFPFNSMAYFNKKYIAATASGIYTMSGNMLNGSLIKSNIKTGTMDFGSNVIKYIKDIWLTYRSNGTVAIVIEVDEDVNSDVEMRSMMPSDKMHEERLGAGTGGVPKGLRGRFYEIEFKNIDGSDFDLDSISLMVETIKRKIR